MSRVRAEKTFNLEPTDRVALQYSVEHPGFLHDFTGVDPEVDLAQATVAAVKKMDADIVGGVPECMETPFEPGQSVRPDEQGNMTTPWGYGSTPWYEGQLGEFSDEEAVLRYNPFEECPLPWRANFGREFARTQGLIGDDAFPMCCVSYFSLVTHCTAVFGWESFLLCSVSRPNEFERVLDRIGQHTLGVIDEMIEVGSGLCAIHDDIAMTRGHIASPQWLRTYALPWYQRFFARIKQAGQKALFISDGNYAEIVDDLLEAGADGFYCEHSFDLEPMMHKCRDRAFLLASFDQRVLASGSASDVRRQAHQHLALAKCQNGSAICLTVPHDVRLENIHAFLHTFQSESAL